MEAEMISACGPNRTSDQRLRTYFHSVSDSRIYARGRCWPGLSTPICEFSPSTETAALEAPPPAVAMSR